tara:strand:+ start:3376 stop:4611 length:1236 start_codon:yes stop_codon:yes gene_type:complete
MSEGKEDGASIAGILTASDLTYLADTETNCVSERSQRKTSAQKAQYTERQTIVLLQNTGSDFISNKNSALQFKLGLTGGTATTSFGGGSVLNIFENIRVISRSGDVLSDVSKVNLYNYYMNKIGQSFEARSHQSGRVLLGYGTDYDSGFIDQNIVDGQEFIVPLRDLLPFFDDDVLLPSVVARGLRIEITLASTASVFVDSAGSPVSAYTVDSPELLLDSYRLSSGAMNALNSMAAKDGLVLTFKDVDSSQTLKTASQTKVSIEVTQAVSMANSVITAIRPHSDNELITADSFATKATTATDSYQYRIGSVYLPQESIVGSKQYYNQMKYCFDRLNTGKELSIRHNEFGKNNLAVACLDRYWTSGSGLAINASTVLNFKTTVATGTESDVDIFLCHTRRVVCFLESLRVLT